MVVLKFHWPILPIKMCQTVAAVRDPTFQAQWKHATCNQLCKPVLPEPSRWRLKQSGSPNPASFLQYILSKCEYTQGVAPVPHVRLETTYIIIELSVPGVYRPPGGALGPAEAPQSNESVREGAQGTRCLLPGDAQGTGGLLRGDARGTGGLLQGGTARSSMPPDVDLPQDQEQMLQWQQQHKRKQQQQQQLAVMLVGWQQGLQQQEHQQKQQLAEWAEEQKRKQQHQERKGVQECLGKLREQLKAQQDGSLGQQQQQQQQQPLDEAKPEQECRASPPGSITYSSLYPRCQQ
jgi:hypothetical protein